MSRERPVLKMQCNLLSQDDGETWLLENVQEFETATDINSRFVATAGKERFLRKTFIIK